MSMRISTLAGAGRRGSAPDHAHRGYTLLFSIRVNTPQLAAKGLFNLWPLIPVACRGVVHYQRIMEKCSCKKREAITASCADAMIAGDVLLHGYGFEYLGSDEDQKLFLGFVYRLAPE